jgi:biotin carboxyl carrier protein
MADVRELSENITEAGEVVLILEAMKMQNELRASQSGVVKQINI